ncbi:four helix bundle protein [Ekhidna sp.]|uniref:four helix bundle protein n=1 Tax=Ekhidna sp. TaxID=2608089 RepID=UPI003CCC128A
MHDFRKLDVWEKSMQLATNVYALTSTYPDTEKYGLISQMRRSSVSIPSNIAEGAGRNHNKEFAQFLSISMGSAFELETQVLLSIRLNLIKKENVKHILEELESICKMLNVLKQRFTKICPPDTNL